MPAAEELDLCSSSTHAGEGERGGSAAAPRIRGVAARGAHAAARVGGGCTWRGLVRCGRRQDVLIRICARDSTHAGEGERGRCAAAPVWGVAARLEDPRQRAAAVAQQGRRSRPRVVEEVGVRWGWHR